jgi:hypothetical protein
MTDQNFVVDYSHLNINLGQHVKEHSPYKKKECLRKGKWTTEEEEYADKVIETFNAGLLKLEDHQKGMTLRAFLADKLDCDPMRITKKYTGASCLGKKVYHYDPKNINGLDADKTRKELDALELRFRSKLEQMRRKKSNDHSYAYEQSKTVSTPAIDALVQRTKASVVSPHNKDSQPTQQAPAPPVYHHPYSHIPPPHYYPMSYYHPPPYVNAPGPGDASSFGNHFSPFAPSTKLNEGSSSTLRAATNGYPPLPDYMRGMYPPPPYYMAPFHPMAHTHYGFMPHPGSNPHFSAPTNKDTANNGAVQAKDEGGIKRSISQEIEDSLKKQKMDVEPSSVTQGQPAALDIAAAVNDVPLRDQYLFSSAMEQSLLKPVLGVQIEG